MKKLLALLLCALMVLGGLPALADTDYAALSDEELRAAYQSVLTEMAARAAGDAAPVTAPAEITFRGIPWGTSATEFADLMAKDGVNGSARKGGCLFLGAPQPGRMCDHLCRHALRPGLCLPGQAVGPRGGWCAGVEG